MRVATQDLLRRAPRAAADNEERAVATAARAVISPLFDEPGEHDAADERHHAHDQREVDKRLAVKTLREQQQD
jgi:hypothetical protein